MDVEEIKLLQNCLTNAKNFAVFRFPNEKNIRIIKVKKSIIVQKIEDLRKYPSSFVFAPFSTKYQPIIILQSDNEQEIKIDNEQDFPKHKKSCSIMKKSVSVSYANDFQHFHAGVKQQFQKLVLSRTEEISKSPDAIQLFLEACHTYSNAMVYLFSSEKTGVWLGATPEILLEGRDGKMHTIALAGTMKKDESRAQPSWSKKNQQEQAIVTEYLRRRIQKFCKIETENGPYSYGNSQLLHLRTDLYFSVSAEKICDIIEELHPTPAVCGIPKESAIDFILNNESKTRTYYAGFLGWYEPEKETRLYVNLRCMRWIDTQTVQLIAGGGILPESTLEQEWRETEEKMETLRGLDSFE